MPLTNGIYFAEFSPRQTDDNPTLVFIHGAGGDSLFWPRNLRRFANHRTLSIDLPGHGKSNPPGRQSVDHYSQIIESWLADLSLKQTILIGYELGASIAAQIAAEYPHLAQSLILINSILKKNVSENTINHLTNPVTAQNMINRYIHHTLQLRNTNEHHRDFLRSLQTIRPAVLAGDLMAQNEKILIKVAKQIKQPVCIIENKADKDQLTSEQNYTLQLLPEATILYAEHNSKLLPIDEPQWIASQIQTFLRIIKDQQSAQILSSLFLDMDISEEGSYAIRTD